MKNYISYETEERPFEETKKKVCFNAIAYKEKLRGILEKLSEHLSDIKRNPKTQMSRNSRKQLLFLSLLGITRNLGIKFHKFIFFLNNVRYIPG